MFVHACVCAREVLSESLCVCVCECVCVCVCVMWVSVSAHSKCMCVCMCICVCVSGGGGGCALPKAYSELRRYTPKFAHCIVDLFRSRQDVPED